VAEFDVIFFDVFKSNRVDFRQPVTFSLREFIWFDPEWQNCNLVFTFSTDYCYWLNCCSDFCRLEQFTLVAVWFRSQIHWKFL